MNIMATLKRVPLMACAATFALLVAGCATTPHSVSVAGLDEGVAESGTSFADESLGDTEGAMDSSDFAMGGMERSTEIIESRHTLTDVGNEALGLELLAGTNFNQMVITAEGIEPDYRVLRLSSPERLVIDIVNSQTRLNRIFEIEQSDFISRVRIGAHADKSRIVLDLVPGASFAHNVDMIDNQVMVTVANEENMNMILSQLKNMPMDTANTDFMAAPDPMIFEDAENEASANTEDSEFGDTGMAADTEMGMQQEPMIMDQNQAPAMADSRPKLVALQIEVIPGEGNRIIADMESAGYFTLEKTAPSEYVLRLEGASFDAQMIQTVLAPPQSGMLRSVRPVVDGNDTLLRIFSTPTAKLSANVKNGNIIVQAQAIGAENQYGADARAQLSPEDEASVELSDEEPTNGGGQDDFSALLDTPKFTGRLISLDLQDTDIDNALRIIAEVSNLNIIASDDVTGKVTLRLIDVPWDQALDVILKTNGLDMVQEGTVVRIAPVEKLRQEREALKLAKDAEEELEPLVVKYLRVSYARAAELKPLVETVMSERGTVAYDERTNQLIIKDIRKGLKNVVELVRTLDLRTPQVLLETQIVEAQKTLLRELGSELGFTILQSPETGNATGYNFPNSIEVGGSVSGAGEGVASSFPAAGDELAGSAISILLDSADGAYSLDTRLSALEQEGRVRVVSRPAVATTNNRQAVIKSVEKLRIKTPDGGLSVATGAGASASGGSGVATEVIEIGIILEVTPQASPDYYVLLDIDAKSSTLGSTEVDGIPSEIERSATSTVLVSSGQTFAMGGIYKINDQTRISGVPFFKDIPVLGHLFRFSGVENSDEELIFFITPRIVEGSFDDAAMRVAS